jgi:hypothetical protein
MKGLREAASRDQSPSPASPLSKVLGPLLGLAIAAICVGGMIALNRSAAGAPIDLLVGADVSGSQTEKERRQYFSVLDAVIDDAFPSGSSLTVWSFDNKSGKLYEGNPRQATDLHRLQDEIIHFDPGIDGTTPSCVLPDILNRAKSMAAQGRAVAVMLLWDAEDSDPQETKKLVEELAAVPWPPRTVGRRHADGARALT